MGNYFSNTEKTNDNNKINLNKKILSNDIVIHKLNSKELDNKKINQLSNDIIKSINFDKNSNIYKIGTNLEITFKNSFNKNIDEKIINKLRLYDKIIFGFSFNQDVKNKIPTNVISIHFGHNFNKSIDNLTIEDEIDNIEEIILGERFNQEVNNLSPGLKRISFGYEFNKTVNNLPNKLEYIRFGHDFNNNVDYLPCSLEYIIFGESFNKNIDNLPSTIKCLELSKNFNHQINFIPIGLEKIKFVKKYYEDNKEHLNNIISSNEYIEISF